MCLVQVVDTGSLQPSQCHRERGRHRCHTCHSECCWRVGADGRADSEAVCSLQHQSQVVLIAMQWVRRLGRATLTRTGRCAPQHRCYRTQTLALAVDHDRLCSQSRIRCCRGRSTRVLLQRRLLVVVVSSCVVEFLHSSCGLAVMCLVCVRVLFLRSDTLGK
jgi:hypothetical protein